MRISAQVKFPTFGGKTARPWVRSFSLSWTTRLPLLAGTLVACFTLTPAAVAQQAGGPATTDVAFIPKPIGEIYERVLLRDLGNNAQPVQKTTKKEDTCLLPPLTNVSGPVVAAAALAVPAKAKNEYLKACTALEQKKTESAEKHLHKAVKEYPNYGAAWVTLGQMLAVQNHSEEARSACSQGSSVVPEFVPAYLCLADMAARDKAWGEVLRLSNRALAVDPNSIALAYEYNAAGNLRTNKLDDAEKSGLRAVQIDKDNREPRVHFLLAQIYEAKGDRANEIIQLREYLKFAANSDDATVMQQLLSQLEKPNVPAANPGAHPQQESPNSSIAPSAHEDRKWEKPDVSETSHESTAVPEKLARPGRIDDGATACHLDTVLPQIEHRIQDFVEDVQRFTATELLVYDSLNGSGQVAFSERLTYDYLVSIEQVGPRLLAVNEYQHGRSSSEKSRVIVVNSGLPALPLIFHPYYSGDFSMECEGLTEFNGMPVWQIRFRQRRDKASRIRSYRVGLAGRTYELDLEGYALFLADNYQIVKLETDLAKTIPEIQLTLDHASAEFGPVHFQSRGIDVWLPLAAEFVSERKGKRTHERRTFSDYLLFAVDDHQQISSPKIQKENLIQRVVAERNAGDPLPGYVY
jgi:tetratricopeptide (TPR) repeat protein